MVKKKKIMVSRILMGLKIIKKYIIVLIIIVVKFKIFTVYNLRLFKTQTRLRFLQIIIT